MEMCGVKVVLRDWREADLDRYAYWLNPGHRWQELDGPYYPKPNPAELTSLIGRERAQIQADDAPSPRTTLVVADSETDELMGRVSWYWESIETFWPGIGISIFDPARWGQGIGYEALGLWSDYLFRELPNIMRLDLRTWSGNVGMMHLAEKLGYKEEARFRKARVVNGLYYDGLGYGVLRDEWQQMYPQGFAPAISG